jgi:hypothetical protein
MYDVTLPNFGPPVMVSEQIQNFINKNSKRGNKNCRVFKSLRCVM